MTIAEVRVASQYAVFRYLARRFDLPACTDWGCELDETDEEDPRGDRRPAGGESGW